MKKDAIIKKLAKIVGADWVRTDDLSRYHFGNDVLTHFGQGALYPDNKPHGGRVPGLDERRAEGH